MQEFNERTPTEAFCPPALYERRHWMIRGRVQGVYYRASLHAQAQTLGLVGWCRNRSDGAVEVMAEGSPNALDKLEAWCWQGPSLAQVNEVVCLDRVPLNPPDPVLPDPELEEGHSHDPTQPLFSIRATV